MGISISGGGGVNAVDLQGILPPNTIEYTRLSNGDSIMFRETVPSGYTARVISLEALNQAGDHESGLAATVSAQNGGSESADGEFKFSPENPLLEVTGPDTLTFEMDNSTGGTVISTAAFRYIFTEQ